MTPNDQSVAVREKVGAGTRISSADTGACGKREQGLKGGATLREKR